MLMYVCVYICLTNVYFHVGFHILLSGNKVPNGVSKRSSQKSRLV